MRSHTPRPLPRTRLFVSRACGSRSYVPAPVSSVNDDYEIGAGFVWYDAIFSCKERAWVSPLVGDSCASERVIAIFKFTPAKRIRISDFRTITRDNHRRIYSAVMRARTNVETIMHYVIRLVFEIWMSMVRNTIHMTNILQRSMIQLFILRCIVYRCLSVTATQSMSVTPMYSD